MQISTTAAASSAKGAPKKNADESLVRNGALLHFHLPYKAGLILRCLSAYRGIPTSAYARWSLQDFQAQLKAITQSVAPIPVDKQVRRREDGTSAHTLAGHFLVFPRTTDIVINFKEAYGISGRDLIGICILRKMREDVNRLWADEELRRMIGRDLEEVPTLDKCWHHMDCAMDILLETVCGCEELNYHLKRLQ